MKVTLALLADFANKAVDGKLNVLGVFNTIFAEKFPAVHPEMKLVIRFELHPAEMEEPKKVQIRLVDAQGTKIFELSGEMKVQAPPGEGPRGEMFHYDNILSMNGLPIQAPGDYEFVILVNGEVKALVPLKAVVRSRA